MQRRKNMQMTKWLIFYQSPDCLEACLDLYVICSFLTNICAYFLFAWDVISLWFVVSRRCFPLSCLSNMRQKNPHQIHVRTVQLCVKEGRYTFSFFLQFSVLYWKRENKAALNPTSPFIERSEFRPVVHCIYVKHPEWLRRSLAVHYVSLHLPTISAGFAEMCPAIPPHPLHHQCTFLFFDKLIRAAGLKRLFQMCAWTRTRTHTHAHVWVWTPRQADTPFSAQLLIVLSASDVLPIPVKQVLTFEELSAESIYKGLRALCNHKACVEAWTWIRCRFYDVSPYYGQYLSVFWQPLIQPDSER